ncbi:hypothetical protein [Aestuariivirga litoralis]|uniref:hypothetical protein n=1 Tax=Aestuariivirga litoralis TaxID=2650924 RepID=UPI0018C55BEE|nr:hypothetical protein [Aestuariivirga litoralis]MBG1231548.1 hypothetical protein [Aestuariivirga litoralis]
MPLAQRVRQIVVDAGGEVVGRTKLQKLVYFLVTAGFEPDIQFFYKHYGPYSEALASASREASLLGLVNEREERAGWGGLYSIYSTDGAQAEGADAHRLQMAQMAAAADAVELELAATALFLEEEGVDDPWNETARRKPEKANFVRLENARALYRRLSAIQSPHPLPNLD